MTEEYKKDEKEKYTEEEFFNNLNKYIDNTEKIDILYNYILNTKKGIKQNKILVLYGKVENIIDIIKKYLLSKTFSISNTNINYFQNLIVNKYISRMQNTHPIYNITKVNKLFIISDNEVEHTLNDKIFQRMIDDKKIITNFIITTNKKSNSENTNNIFISI
jgi:hypothetical protein